MKKLNELNLNVGTTPDAFPASKYNIPVDYKGGHIKNADSAISQRMQQTFTKDYFEHLEDEESEDDDMILKKRKAKNGKYALLETLENIAEEQNSTTLYDKNKNLRGKQSKLPDNLQKAIIKKADPNDPELEKEGAQKNEMHHDEDEESFEEIDLGEMSVGGVAGMVLPLGRSPKSKPDGKHVRTHQENLKEQREYIRKLQAYHQRTTNKLK